MKIGTGHSSQVRVGISDEAWEGRHPNPLAHCHNLRFGISGLERNSAGRNFAFAYPFRNAMAAYGDPSNRLQGICTPGSQPIAGYIDTAEDIRSFQGVKVKRQSFAIVDDADRHVSFPVGQVRKLAGGQDIHLYVWMKTREFGKISHKKARGQGRCQRHPQQSSNALIATGNPCLQLMRRNLHSFCELPDLLARRGHAIARRQLLEYLRPETAFQLRNTPQNGGMVYAQSFCSSPNGAYACHGQEISDVIPVTHGALQHQTGALSASKQNPVYLRSAERQGHRQAGAGHPVH
ncbi:MAG: hypothetical protein GAK38_04560 [Xylophilus sp.]|nr:MAG: hypothetical protein GAK38_04560 [Xylophilus sp.]